MEAAAKVQQNISMNVMNDIMDVEELLELITPQENSWKTAEEVLTKKYIACVASNWTKRRE